MRRFLGSRYQESASSVCLPLWADLGQVSYPGLHGRAEWGAVRGVPGWVPPLHGDLGWSARSIWICQEPRSWGQAHGPAASQGRARWQLSPPRLAVPLRLGQVIHWSFLPALNPGTTEFVLVLMLQSLGDRPSLVGSFCPGSHKLCGWPSVEPTS